MISVAIELKKKISRFPAGFAFVVFLLNPLTGLTQEPQPETHSPISVEVEVTPRQATVGDLITYSIRVRHDANIEPAQPEFTPPGGLEAVDQGTNKLPRKSTQTHKEFWFRLRADLVGTHEFPALTIPFTVANAGNEKVPGQIASPKAQLEVQSILHLEGEPTDIRDIKPLEDIGRNWLPIALAVLAALLVIALGIYLFLKRRKSPLQKSALEQEILPPNEAALRDLEILKNKGLLEKGLIREYYFELSEIFRRYLGATFQFPALDWTTEEIMHFLESSSLPDPGVGEKIRLILEQTDLVKFAKAQGTGEENMTEKIIIFIRETSRPERTEPETNNSAIPS